jgi:dipeptidyl aminopeptidase/acylaminoacyl peptidase
MRIRLTVLFFLFLAACTPQAVSPTPTFPPPQFVIVADTPIPTITPSPTATPTLEQLIFPYTIEGLRQHDFQSGDVEILETLDQTDVFTRYLISYHSDGLTITGILQVPAEGNAPFPVIVMNHGFFTRDAYFSGDGTDRAAEYLNRRGYLTVSSDYRSWGGSDLGPSLFYSGLVIDVVNLINAIPSIPQADSNRIGLWGHSMGGGVTMKVLTLDTPIRAAVLYSTVSADNADLVGRWGMGCFGDVRLGEQTDGCNSSDVLPDGLPRNLTEAYATAAMDIDLNKAVSPYYHLNLVTVPVQINYGTADGKFYGGTPPEWSKKLYQGFVEAQHPAELFAYEGESHSFFADQWVAFMERTAHFFDATVKNAP